MIKCNIISMTKGENDFIYEPLRENLVLDSEFVFCSGYRFNDVDYRDIAHVFDFDKNVCIVYVTPFKTK